MDQPSFEFWHDHAGISVPDLAEAVAWYEKVLGFRVERRITLEAVPAKVAMLVNGNLRIELFEPQGGRPPAENRSVPDEDVRTWGNKHTSFAVEDVFAVSEELRRRGADIVWVKKLPSGTCNMFVRDNAGNLIEFMQRPRPPAIVARL